MGPSGQRGLGHARRLPHRRALNDVSEAPVTQQIESTSLSTSAELRLTMTAAIHARWAHRVNGLIHSHPWALEATLEGPADADKVFPADDLERHLTEAVAPWHGKYLTDTDVGEWHGYEPLVWDREPTVEEICRRLWAHLDQVVPGLIEVALEESTEFDRARTVRLTRPR